MKLFATIVLLLLPLVALAQDAPKAVDVTLSWSVALDEAGTITSLKPAESSNAALYEHLEPSIRAFHFSTGKVDGQPAPAETTLTLNLTLEPVAGGYHIRVRGAGTGARYATMTAPKYPDGAAMSHRGGAVLLDVDYDAQGRVTELHAIDGGNPKPGADIVSAAIAAVKHWTFTPERVAGRGIAGAARVPLCFDSPPARIACRWNDPVSNAPIAADHPATLTSVVHLEGDVAGSTL